MGGSVEQDPGGEGVALAGGDVQGGVASRGGRVWIGLVLQQQFHQLLVTHAGRTVQWRLVVLRTRAGDKDRGVSEREKTLKDAKTFKKACGKR